MTIIEIDGRNNISRLKFGAFSSHLPSPVLLHKPVTPTNSGLPPSIEALKSFTGNSEWPPAIIIIVTQSRRAYALSLGSLSHLNIFSLLFIAAGLYFILKPISSLCSAPSNSTFRMETSPPWTIKAAAQTDILQSSPGTQPLV
jgi:hypothetical protein